ncbi:nicotinate-nucleotide adenylyltransferase [Salinisphaera sp. USBA-960]|uniref:nicotinate-nucleotide adenylyltransferase n=1 Tax=Salinisphaera orenii TaxID=856731 RepID=UPI000DBE78CC|nr:nicotinate-nucleotide adenylyltransferase [Salifodinibacter halophilus]NNC25562.1 nicotinate-nucleotide adenylyltransferase [Salifodinibacter halophilus]
MSNDKPTLEPPIGVLGGTFDPIHHGHLRLALETAEQLHLDEVRMIPNGQPPHRDAPAASAEQRAHWVNLATAPEPRLTMDSRELRRAGRSYTVDTLADMRAEWPNRPLCLIMGRDVFADLPSWHHWRELFELAHIALIDRGSSRPALAAEAAAELDIRYSDDPAILASRPAGAIIPIEPPTLAISASRIRALLAAGASPRYLLPDTVLEELMTTNVYSQPATTERS